MITVFSNLIPKVSETGKTVKQHSHKKIHQKWLNQIL